MLFSFCRVSASLPPFIISCAVGKRGFETLLVSLSLYILLSTMRNTEKRQPSETSGRGGGGAFSADFMLVKKKVTITVIS